MPVFVIGVDETQHWTYYYKVEADTEANAIDQASHLFYDGAQADDDSLMHSEVTSIRSIERVVIEEKE